MSLKTYTIEQTDFFSGDEIFEKIPLFVRNARNPRDMVKVKNPIEASQWIYARATGLSFAVSDGKSTKSDKVFINKAYLLNNSLEIKAYLATNKIIKSTPIETTTNNYPVITLEEHEKFRSDDGSTHEVMVRGERHHEKIFFRIRDIATMLNKDYKTFCAQITRSRDDSCYEEDLHYKLLSASNGGDYNPLLAATEYYLTFNGVLKAIFSSRTGDMHKFTSWVTKITYTAQMGTPEQRVEVANSILKNGPSSKSVIQMLDCRDNRLDKRTGKYKDSSVGVTGLYLISPGSVGQHRAAMNISSSIPDNYLIMKYGLSKDIAQRLSSYPSKDFKDLNVTNDNIEVITTRYVDKEFLEDAESSIASFVEEHDWKLSYKNHEELFIINPNHLKMIREKFHDVSRRYANDASIELNKQLEIAKITYESKVKELTTEFLIKEIKYQNEINLKDKEIELRDKDLAFERLKNEFLQMKLQKK